MRFGRHGWLYCVAQDEVVVFDFETGECLGAVVRLPGLNEQRELFVIARNSSFAFKGKPVDIKQVARDLGVRYVLEGSVRKSGNRIRITGQLIDAASGAHLWADRFDGALEDVFELQDQVASSVVGAIAPSIIHAEMERAKRKPTSSLDAYDYYLRGRAARWQLTRDGTDQAIALYERAIALDPQFAPAHSSLAMALGNRRSWGWSTDPAAEASRAKTYAKSALDLDRQDPLVLTESGNALLISGHGDEFELAASLFGSNSPRSKWNQWMDVWWMGENYSRQLPNSN